jgi:triacylglycerol lipase
MAHAWPNYDPTLEALLHPETRHPEGLHSAGDGWPFEAVCAEFARLAYMRFETDGEEQLATALAKAGFGRPKSFVARAPAYRGWWRRIRTWFRDRDAQAFGATSLDGSMTIVAFRGTQPDSPPDLLTDMRFLPVSWDGPGKVHEGFLRAYESLSPSIEEWLGSEPPRRLAVTGHSLGAAMAALMAVRSRDPEVELVTFGCPLVGNAEFCAALDRRAKVARYVDCSDIVTTVPYTWLGYAQGAKARYIDRHGLVRTSPSESEIKADRKEARRRYREEYLAIGNAPSRQFADHAPVNYVSAVAGKRRDP